MHLVPSALITSTVCVCVCNRFTFNYFIPFNFWAISFGFDVYPCTILYDTNKSESRLPIRLLIVDVDNRVISSLKSAITSTLNVRPLSGLNLLVVALGATEELRVLIT